MGLDPFAVPNLPQRLYPYLYRNDQPTEVLSTSLVLIYVPNEISKDMFTSGVSQTFEDFIHCRSRHPSNFYNFPI